MTNHGTGFSGFLDGYKAQNLGGVAESADFQIKHIKLLLDNIISLFSEKNDILKSFLQDAKAIEFSIPSLMTFGEIIKSLITHEKLDYSGILDNKEFKHLILCFIELAKMCADNKIINITVEIGESLGFNLDLIPK
jgi:hypothetical protein